MAKSDKFDKSPDKREQARKVTKPNAARLSPQQKDRPADGKPKGSGGAKSS